MNRRVGQPADTYDEFVLRSRLYRELDAARSTIINVIGRAAIPPTFYPRGTFLFHQGDPAEAGYLILRGRVKVGFVLDSGSQIIVKVAHRGDFVGHAETQIDVPHTRFAQTVGDTHTIRLDRDQANELLATDHEFARAMYVVGLVRFLESQLSASRLRAGPVHGRLVQLLIRLAYEAEDGCRDGSVIRLELAQEDMASIIGSTRQSVSSLLTLLKNAGLIDVDHRHIVVPSWEALMLWTAEQRDVWGRVRGEPVGR